jgi:hypothetical protein
MDPRNHIQLTLKHAFGCDTDIKEASSNSHIYIYIYICISNIHVNITFLIFLRAFQVTSVFRCFPTKILCAFLVSHIKPFTSLCTWTLEGSASEKAMALLCTLKALFCPHRPCKLYFFQFLLCIIIFFSPGRWLSPGL